VFILFLFAIIMMPAGGSPVKPQDVVESWRVNTRGNNNNGIHGRSGISPEMAIRFSKAFGSTPET
jgi:plasmid maintenance system antidote protein VapI